LASKALTNGKIILEAEEAEEANEAEKLKKLTFCHLNIETKNAAKKNPAKIAGFFCVENRE
jgi:hypothetical protein